MRTKNNRRSLRRHLRKSHRKSYRGGQARWPAPFNPAPPHPLPSVGCRFPDFSPLILSQFGGTKSKSRCAGTHRYKKKNFRKSRKSKSRKSKSIKI